MPEEKGVLMPAENPKKSSLKQKAAHEFEEFLIIFGYLAFFFCALATYSMLLLGKFDISYFTYGAALINALIIAKVILIGEVAHLGKKVEAKPLLYSTVSKAFLFGLLVFAFHLLEEMIKRLIHGKDIVGAFNDIRLDDLLARTLIIFCTFIPLFGFRELRRVIGQDKFRDLLLHGRTGPDPSPSGAVSK